MYQHCNNCSGFLSSPLALAPEASLGCCRSSCTYFWVPGWSHAFFSIPGCQQRWAIILNWRLGDNRRELQCRQGKHKAGCELSCSYTLSPSQLLRHPWGTIFSFAIPLLPPCFRDLLTWERIIWSTLDLASFFHASPPPPSPWLLPERIPSDQPPLVKTSF